MHAATPLSQVGKLDTGGGGLEQYTNRRSPQQFSQHIHAAAPSLQLISRFQPSVPVSTLTLVPHFKSSSIPYVTGTGVANTMGIMNRSLWVTVAALVIVGLLPMLATASDPDPLQDFCVAFPSDQVVINGQPCKPTMEVTYQDFWSAALTKPGNTKNRNLSNVTQAFVAQFPGLNTLGIGAARVDFAKGGINPPHTHPRATEILLLVQGELYVGFVDTNYTLFATTIRAGELFVFPRGLVHFQLNVGKGPAQAFAALNSQNPGTQQIAPALFMSGVSDEVLEKGFRIDAEAVLFIEKQFPKP